MQISPLFFDRQLVANEINKIAVLRKPGQKDCFWVSGNFCLFGSKFHKITLAFQAKVDEISEHPNKYPTEQLKIFYANVARWNQEVRTRNNPLILKVLNIFLYVISFGKLHLGHPYQEVNLYSKYTNSCREALKGVDKIDLSFNGDPVPTEDERNFFLKLKNSEIDTILKLAACDESLKLFTFLINLKIKLIIDKVFEYFICKIRFLSTEAKHWALIELLIKNGACFKGFRHNEIEKIFHHLVSGVEKYTEDSTVVRNLFVLKTNIEQADSTLVSPLCTALKLKKYDAISMLKNCGFELYDHDVCWVKENIDDCWIRENKDDLMEVSVNNTIMELFCWLLKDFVFSQDNLNKYQQTLILSIYKFCSGKGGPPAIEPVLIQFGRLALKGAKFNAGFMEDREANAQLCSIIKNHLQLDDIIIYCCVHLSIGLPKIIFSPDFLGIKSEMNSKIDELLRAHRLEYVQALSQTLNAFPSGIQTMIVEHLF